MDTNDHIDHQRWLIEHGFINDLHKDNLYMYGAIVHRDIQAVQLDIDVANKNVSYDLYIEPALMAKIEKYKKLSKSSSMFGLWCFKRMLKKEGNLNVEHLLSKFVSDYLGPKWTTSVKLKDIKEYVEGFDNNAGTDPATNQQLDSK